MEMLFHWGRNQQEKDWDTLSLSKCFDSRHYFKQIWSPLHPTNNSYNVPDLINLRNKIYGPCTPVDIAQVFIGYILNNTSTSTDDGKHLRKVIVVECVGSPWIDNLEMDTVPSTGTWQSYHSFLTTHTWVKFKKRKKFSSNMQARIKLL